MYILESRKKQSGLTLLEVMITMAIFAIVASVAVPGFSRLIENTKIRTSQERIMTTLQFARAESIKRREALVVCPSSDTRSCEGEWQDGWMVFIDQNEDRIFDGDTDEVLLAELTAVSSVDIDLIGEEEASFLFTSEGFAEHASTFRICGSSENEEFARGVVIQSSGSIRVSLDSNSDSVAEDHEGEEFSCLLTLT